MAFGCAWWEMLGDSNTFGSHLSQPGALSSNIIDVSSLQPQLTWIQRNVIQNMWRAPGWAKWELRKENSVLGLILELRVITKQN